MSTRASAEQGDRLIERVVVRAPNDADQPPLGRSGSSSRWLVSVCWSVGGDACPQEGDWQVRAFVESIGAGPTMQIGPTRVVPAAAAASIGAPCSYVTAIPIPQGAVPDGKYRLTVGVDLTGAEASRGLAAFHDAGVFEFRGGGATAG